MLTMTATEASKKFGQVLERGVTEAVQITKHSKPVAYMVPAAEYDEMQGSASGATSKKNAAAALRAMRGIAKGTWGSVEEIDAHIREGRDDDR